MRRGEVWWANLGEPWGRRPVLLVSRDEAYLHRRWVMVAPLSTAIRDNPSFVTLDPELDGIPKPSAVNLESIQTVQKDWLDTYIVRLRDEQLRAVERAIHFALRLRNCS
jgi:mRNA interferase MazF